MITASYSVEKGAKQGPRDLKVQFASVILDAPRVLFVDK
jgi:hypothetical protein